MFKIIIAIVILLCSWSIQPAEKVVVIDGDTVKVGSEKIRLAEIDAPEVSQRFGMQSKNYLAHLVEGKSVKVDRNGKDLYGRTIATLYVDGKNINAVMVENGMAWSYRSANMRRLELKARHNKAGLWQDASPVRPSEYRKARSSNG